MPTFGHIEPGRILVMLNRKDYWQCAYVIAKGSAEAMRTQDSRPSATRSPASSPVPPRSRRRAPTWDDVSLLTVSVDRLAKWSRAGLLCIGDAAHAMSPIGGVGINLAIQDAVATANLLGKRLLEGAPIAA